MLYEINNPRQVPGEGRRRWFTDGFFDLIVWYERAADRVSGFQLCYDTGWKERALTWRRGEGYDHKRVDDGEVSGRMKMTPILVPDGIFDHRAIADRFHRESETIDPEIRELVYTKLLSYPQSAP